MEVRVAHPDELADIVALRLAWTREGEGDIPDAAGYVVRTTEWARAHGDTHVPHVAVVDGAIVGMAWLALTPRVPSVSRIDRLSGDLQACSVLPEHRGRGIGGALIEAVLATAAERGAEHVTVHASERSVELYARHGFRHSHRLLWAGEGD